MPQALDRVCDYFPPETLTGGLLDSISEAQPPDLIQLLANPPEDTARRLPCDGALCSVGDSRISESTCRRTRHAAWRVRRHQENPQAEIRAEKSRSDAFS
jgi:hypothetical protein